MRYRISSHARTDLKEIRDYIARDKPLAAARTVASIHDAIRKVVSPFPQSGTARDDLTPGLRCFGVGNYVVCYRVGESIEILRVVHGARNLDAMWGDE